MKTIITLPLPFDKWDVFAPFIKRFCDTFKQFEPGADCEVWGMCCSGYISDEVELWFDGINAVFHKYPEDGCDIGSAQYAADMLKENAFMVNMTSRCYFHRPGWLKRLLEAREKHGDGMYSTFASWEGGTPHLGTRAYCLDSHTFQRYPHIIDTREKGQKFEVGEWCITSWFRQQSMPTMQVTWSGEQEQADWRKPDNIFRKGDQSNCLVFDRHTDLYQDADDVEKLRLNGIAAPAETKT